MHSPILEPRGDGAGYVPQWRRWASSRALYNHPPQLESPLQRLPIPKHPPSPWCTRHRIHLRISSKPRGHGPDEIQVGVGTFTWSSWWVWFSSFLPSFRFNSHLFIHPSRITPSNFLFGPHETINDVLWHRRSWDSLTPRTTPSPRVSSESIRRLYSAIRLHDFYLDSESGGDDYDGRESSSSPP